MIRLYNSMSRSVEELKPLEDNIVKIYTCGPTVYDFPHIGNWYAFLRWDILARTLIASGYKIDWVMNITDVGHLVSDADEGEDKLEKGARREGKTAWEVAEFYTDYFLKGLKRLNFIMPDHLPKATDYINEQLDFIRDLESKGYTYQIDDGIYFDTSKVIDYGKLARLDVKALKAGARVEFNSQKRQLTDFALWKFSPKEHKRDMEWESPWGKGFPGWHIECSALIKKFLGTTIDIHAGGIDHLSVHHPNEIAQSESLNKKPLASIWLHTNFIQVNSQKMSKSLGNLITIEDIEAKGFSLEAFRLLVLESHYRSEAQFSWETLAAAQNRLNKYQAMAQLRFQPKGSNEYFKDDKTRLILDALQDDLNTPQALSQLSYITEEVLESGIATEEIAEFCKFLESVDKILGFKFFSEPDISQDQKELIAKRESARQNQDWAKSDEIRGQLQKQGIELRDTQFGAIWNRL